MPLTNPYSFSFSGITFGGTGSPYQIQSVEGLEGLPAIRNQDDNRGYQDGMFSGRDFYGGRVISIIFNTFGSGATSAQTNFNTIQAKLLPQESGTTPLYFLLPPFTEQFINARVRALRKASSTEEADLLLMTNTDDGSMGVFSIMRSQQVTSPSEFTTDGLFIDVGVDVNAIYVVTQRVFNGTTRFFIELFGYEYFTDCAFVGGAAASASSLPHVAKALNVITDGSPQGNETVSGGGSVTFDRASTTSYEVGLPITVYVKTMPAEVKLQTGSRVSFKKRIVEISALVNKLFFHLNHIFGCLFNRCTNCVF